MNSMNPLLPWKNLYANLLVNVQQLTYQLSLVNQENIDLGKTLTNQILMQQQLNFTLHQENTSRETQKPQSNPPQPQPGERNLARLGRDERKIRKNKQESYSCPYDQCERVYKSAISLNLHIKLNHKGGTKKEREAYAVCSVYIQKQLLDAEQGLCCFPSEKLNLPPKFLEQFKKNYEYCKKYNM